MLNTISDVIDVSSHFYYSLFWKWVFKDTKTVAGKMCSHVTAFFFSSTKKMLQVWCNRLYVALGLAIILKAFSQILLKGNSVIGPFFPTYFRVHWAYLVIQINGYIQSFHKKTFLFILHNDMYSKQFKFQWRVLQNSKCLILYFLKWDHDLTWFTTDSVQSCIGQCNLESIIWRIVDFISWCCRYYLYFKRNINICLPLSLQNCLFWFHFLVIIYSTLYYLNFKYRFFNSLFCVSFVWLTFSTVYFFFIKKGVDFLFYSVLIAKVTICTLFCILSSHFRRWHGRNSGLNRDDNLFYITQLYHICEAHKNVL